MRGMKCYQEIKSTPAMVWRWSRNQYDTGLCAWSTQKSESSNL